MEDTVNETAIDFEQIKRQRGFEVVEKAHRKSYGLNEEPKMPMRGTRHSAGYDFFAPHDVEILPNDSTLVWTDIKSYMLDDEVLELYPRGSTGNKHKVRLGNTVGIVDSDYYSNVKNDGNIGLMLYNFGKKVKTFKKGDAIVQGIFKKFLESDNCNTEVERKGGQGHTTNEEDKD